MHQNAMGVGTDIPKKNHMRILSLVFKALFGISVKSKLYIGR
jgi:hypothetical protein